MNAKQELLDHVGGREVIYVQVIREQSLVDDRDSETIAGLLDEVLPKLDFEYHEGYGTQELNGTVWYSDGMWSDRREYDGSEWWEHHECPSLPVETTFAQRVEAEKAALDEKIEKLNAFLSGYTVTRLSPSEHLRLVEQREAMEDYSAILHERIRNEFK